MLDQLSHRGPEYLLDFPARFRHHLCRLLPFVVPDLGGNLAKLVGNTKADVLPDKRELLGNVLQRRIVSRIVERPQPLCGILAQRRVRCQERFDQTPSACREFPQLALHLLQQRQWAKVNAGLERQARIVEVAPDLSIEVGDRAQLF